MKLSEERRALVADRLTRMVDPEDRATSRSLILSRRIVAEADRQCSDYRNPLGEQQAYLWFLGIGSETMYLLMGHADLVSRMDADEQGEPQLLNRLIKQTIANVLQAVEFERRGRDCDGG